MRGGKIAYEGNTFAGYIGLPTAMRPGGWSVSCDSRFNGGGVNLLANIKAAKAGAKTIGIMVRDALESAATYDDMIGLLNTTEVIAPAYYIVAGTQAGEGAVVTRNRDGPDQSHNNEGIWSIGKGGSYPHTGDWWRLETNFDHWSPLNDGRRGHANKAMAAIGQASINFDTLETLLSTKPVLASDTVYTAKISPLKATYETIVRTGY